MLVSCGCEVKEREERRGRRILGVFTVNALASQRGNGLSGAVSGSAAAELTEHYRFCEIIRG